MGTLLTRGPVSFLKEEVYGITRARKVAAHSAPFGVATLITKVGFGPIYFVWTSDLPLHVFQLMQSYRVF